MLDAGYDVISMARRAGEMSHPRLTHMQVDLLDEQATAQPPPRRWRAIRSAT